MEQSRRFNDNEPCWLIKADSKIHGPFSFNEVLARLTSGELQPFHEAMAPLDRWRSLQTQQLFAGAVERIRKQREGPSEHTFTRTERTSFTRTLDLNTGQTPTPFKEQVTPTPPPLDLVPPPVQYQPPQQPIFYPRERKNSLGPVVATALILLVAIGGYFMFSKRKLMAPQSAKSNFVAYVDRGLSSKKGADWHEALRNFKQAHQLNSKDADLIFEMSPLLIQLENQTTYAKNLMEKVMHGQYKRENLALGRNIIGLAFSYEKNYKTAVRNYEDALESDESYFPALINKGYSLMRSGKYNEAEAALSQAVNSHNSSFLPYIYLLENFLIEGYQTNDVRSFTKAFQVASQVASRKIFDGQQEVLLFQAYAAMKIGKDTAYVQSLLQKSLAVDPDQTSDHLHSPLIDWRGLNWANFTFVCAELSKVMKQDVLSMLEFVCTYKSNNEIAAQQIVEGWMNRSRNSPLPHIAQAIISNRLGEAEKAMVSLKVAKEFGANDKLYYQTLVKVCAQLKDTRCLKNNYEMVAKYSPLHAYLAKAMEGSFTSGDRNQAIYSGLRESNNYIPLIRLQ